MFAKASFLAGYWIPLLPSFLQYLSAYVAKK